MKVEDCIVTVERRSTGGCLDLALVFTRRFWRPLYTLDTLVRRPLVPLCLVDWAGTR